MARKQQDNAPAAQPACKAVEREKDRWREVRDPRGELVCATFYERGVVEVVRPARSLSEGRLQQPR